MKMFQCKLYSILGFVLQILFITHAANNDGSVQVGTFLKKPHGLFYCKARCVALCLEMNFADNVTECEQKMCPQFDEESTICDSNDIECWQKCGAKPSPDDQLAPLRVEKIKAEFQQFDKVTDPYTVRADWTPNDGATLYVFEAFLIETGLRLDDERFVQAITTSTFYVFEKPDLCGSYLIRVTAVNRYGVSIPRYKRFSDWRPSENINLNLEIESMSRSQQSPDSVKVLINYKIPNTWGDDDVRITDFLVKAYDCNGVILENAGFQSAKPDENGYYYPVTSTRQPKWKTIEVGFEAGVLDAKCKYSFKILALTTRCGAITEFENQSSNTEINFAIDCHTVKNAHCEKEQPSQIESATVAVDPLPRGESGYESIYKWPSAIRNPDSFEGQLATNTPPSPWYSQTEKMFDNDAWSALFQAFMEGFKENENSQAKPPVLIDQTDQTVPPAPFFPAPVSESKEETDNGTDNFFAAFEESLDNDTTTTKDLPKFQLKTVSSISVANETDDKLPHGATATSKKSGVTETVRTEEVKSDENRAFLTSRALACALLMTLIFAVLVIMSLTFYGLKKRKRQPYALMNA